jgi:hypothetical protein
MQEQATTTYEQALAPFKALIDEAIRRVGQDYAIWLVRCTNPKIPYSQIPNAGTYWTFNKEKTRARLFLVQVAKNTEDGVICFLEGKQLPKFPAPDDPEQRGWMRLWPYAAKNPISKQTYLYLKEHGVLPGESPAAAADRAIQAKTQAEVAAPAAAAIPAAAIPAADRNVTRSDNLPPPPAASAPDEDPFTTLNKRYEPLKIEAESLIKKGAATTKEEADRASDLASSLLQIEKAGKDGYDLAKAPYDAQIKELQVKWGPLRTGAESLKKQIKNQVCDPYAKAEKKRLENERAAAIAQNVDPAALPSTEVRMGSGLSRRSSLQTVRTAVIEDYDAFLQHIKAQTEIREAVEKIAQIYARANIVPLPPGLKYIEDSKTV